MDSSAKHFLVDGIDRMALYEIEDQNSLRVIVATTGYRGGDTGHGGRTRIAFDDLGGTDMECVVSQVDGNQRIEIRLGGDSELETFIKALRFAADALDSLAGPKPAHFE